MHTLEAIVTTMSTTPPEEKKSKVVRTTITITPVLSDAARLRIRKFGYTGMSDYIQSLLRKDLFDEMAT